jgi:4-amino-4-deoxy-L-arabinose transferase-like glycosyltransferase
VFSAVYLGCTGLIAWHRPLFYDEVFTFYIARLDSPGAVVEALRNGADNHPPLDYLLRHWSMRLFGVGEFGLRVPSVAGFWVFCLCLYRFISRRASAMAALLALVAPLASLSYRFSFEARSYALLLGLSGVTCVCWQNLCDGRRRWWNTVGLGLSLAGAVNLHYYGLVIYVPLAVGEAVRLWQRRRPDWLVAAAMAASMASAAALAPFLGVARRYAAHFVRGELALPLQLGEIYVGLFPHIVLGLVVAVGALVLYRLAGRGPESRRPAVRLSTPVHELAFTAAFLLIPLAILVMGWLVANTVRTRYGLVATGGAILIAVLLLVELLPARREILAAAFAGVLAVAVLSLAVAVGHYGRPGRGRERAAGLAAVARGTDLPVVCGLRRKLIEDAPYLDSDVLARLYYVASPQAGVRWNGEDTAELANLGLGPFTPAQVLPYAEFLARFPRFAIAFPQMGSWLVHQLAADGARLEVGKVAGQMVLLVTLPATRAAPPGR